MIISISQINLQNGLRKEQMSMMNLFAEHFLSIIPNIEKNFNKFPKLKTENIACTLLLCTGYICVSKNC